MLQRPFHTPWKHIFSRLLLLVPLALVGPLTASTPSYAEQSLLDDASGPVIVKPVGKLSARLTQLAAPAMQVASAQAQASAVGLSQRGPGSLVTSAQGEILVDLRVTDTTTATLHTLTQNGARIVHVAPDYSTVTAYLRIDQLNGLAALASVSNIREELRPRVAGTGVARQQLAARAPLAASCPSGLVSEGDQQLKAAQARTTFGVDGAGVTVGVISDSYNSDQSLPTTVQADIASGDLPGAGNTCGFTRPVNVLADDTSGTDEGRAMLQIVHDLTPASSLAFATADNGLFSFADNVRALRKAGANVIVDDIGYFNEPFFQDGPVSVAIQDVTSSGALYFTAVGNDDLTDTAGNAIGSYEASYRPQTCPQLTDDNRVFRPGNDCHNFNPKGQDSLEGITLAAGGGFNMILQWAEPWYGVTTDFDVYLVTKAGVLVTSAGTDRNTGSQGTQQPFEIVSYTNFTTSPQALDIVIARHNGSGTPRIKYILLGSRNSVSATEYNATNSTDLFGPDVYGHAMETSALSIAAVPFNDATTPETYSSRGPATVYFGPVKGTQPAARLSNPETRNKPDVAATDGGKTTFFADQEADGFYRFYGTSAAAPHAAAIGALMLQQASKVDRLVTQNRATNLLINTAAVIPNGIVANVGGGLIDAPNAVGAVADLPPLTRQVLLPFVQR